MRSLPVHLYCKFTALVISVSVVALFVCSDLNRATLTSANRRNILCSAALPLGVSGWAGRPCCDLTVFCCDLTLKSCDLTALSPPVMIQHSRTHCSRVVCRLTVAVQAGGWGAAVPAYRYREFN